MNPSNRLPDGSANPLWVYGAIQDAEGLTTSCKAVLSALARSLPDVRPGRSLIAKRSGLSVRTVAGTLVKLGPEGHGLIVIGKLPSTKGGFDHNSYTIDVDRLDSFRAKATIAPATPTPIGNVLPEGKATIALASGTSCPRSIKASIKSKYQKTNGSLEKVKREAYARAYADGQRLSAPEAVFPPPSSQRDLEALATFVEYWCAALDSDDALDAIRTSSAKYRAWAATADFRPGNFEPNHFVSWAQTHLQAFAAKGAA